MGVGPVGFSIAQQDQLWEMWRGGESSLARPAGPRDAHPTSHRTPRSRAADPAHPGRVRAAARRQHRRARRRAADAHLPCHRLTSADPQRPRLLRRSPDAAPRPRPGHPRRLTRSWRLSGRASRLTIVLQDVAVFSMGADWRGGLSNRRLRGRRCSTCDDAWPGLRRRRAQWAAEPPCRPVHQRRHGHRSAGAHGCCRGRPVRGASGIGGGLHGGQAGWCRLPVLAWRTRLVGVPVAPEPGFAGGGRRTRSRRSARCRSARRFVRGC